MTRIATRDASRGVFRRCRRVNTQRGRSPTAPAGPRAPPVGRCRLGPRASADPSDRFFFPPRAPPHPQLVLDKESFTLEELLEEDDVIQECKSLNSRLIN